MARLESSAWSLAAGSATLFALSVLLKSLTWTVAFVVLVLAVAAWSLHAAAITGLALGVIAWSFLTGFDVNADGALRLHGWADLVRVCALIGAAFAGTAAGRIFAWSRSRTNAEPEKYEEPIWAAPHRLVGDGLRRQAPSGMWDGDHHNRVRDDVEHIRAGHSPAHRRQARDRANLGRERP